MESDSAVAGGGAIDIGNSQEYTTAAPTAVRGCQGLRLDRRCCGQDMTEVHSVGLFT